MTALIVALKAEARPLIELFNLKLLGGNTLFPIWESREIKLIISGVGKTQAAAAVGYLAGIHRDEGINSWLNIGIAGHRSLPLGTPLLAHKVTDAARHISFFPSFSFLPPCDTISCLTLDKPTADYPKKSLCEMEAAGFCTIATKIAPIETVHVFKVVSDNPESPVKEVTKKKVEELIGDHSATIQTIVEEMQALGKELIPPDVPFLDTFLKKWHFTTCQTQQLKKALQRWQILYPNQIILSQEILLCKTAKEVLILLTKKLEDAPLVL